MGMAGGVLVIVRMLMLMIVWMRMGMFLWCVSVMAFDQHARFARAAAAAIYGFKDESCTEVEGCGRFLEQRGGDAGGGQGAEQHVTAQTGEAFEIADTHGCSHGCRKRYLPVRTASG